MKETEDQEELRMSSNLDTAQELKDKIKRIASR